MIVATLASLSTRYSLLERVVTRLLPQVDALCVYLNGYNRLPPFLKHPKVAHAILSNDAGWRGAEAKLWFWDRDAFKATPIWGDDDIAIICDDDLNYPPDYVARHVEFLNRKPDAISCVHGSVLVEPFKRYADDRMVARIHTGLNADIRVHVPGTGTMAFRRGALDISIKRDVVWSHCVDVMVALAAKNQGVECWSIPRPANWLSAMSLPKNGTGIFKARTGARNDSYETEILRKAEPWVKLPTDGLTLRNR